MGGDLSDSEGGTKGPVTGLGLWRWSVRMRESLGPREQAC